jgi:hypothetical protein
MLTLRKGRIRRRAHRGGREDVSTTATWIQKVFFNFKSVEASINLSRYNTSSVVFQGGHDGRGYRNLFTTVEHPGGPT